MIQTREKVVEKYDQRLLETLEKGRAAMLELNKQKCKTASLEDKLTEQGLGLGLGQGLGKSQ